jgi:hypothetical protein
LKALPPSRVSRFRPTLKTIGAGKIVDVAAGGSISFRGVWYIECESYPPV